MLLPKAGRGQGVAMKRMASAEPSALHESPPVAGQSDTNGDADVFLFRRLTGEVSLVSHPAALSTTAGDLTAGDYNGTNDVFLDRAPTHPGAT